MRFQQFSSPVMAKGVEDTAFYRYYPLASLNEVGGDPARFGVSVQCVPSPQSDPPRTVAEQHERQLHARYQARRGCAGANQRAVGNARRMVSRDSPLARAEPRCENHGRTIARRRTPTKSICSIKRWLAPGRCYPMNRRGARRLTFEESMATCRRRCTKPRSTPVGSIQTPSTNRR